MGHLSAVKILRGAGAFPGFGFAINQRAMPKLLILTEVQEAMRARYKAMLLERFPDN